MIDIDLKPENIKTLIEPNNFLCNKKTYIDDFKKTNIKGDFKNYIDQSLEEILKKDKTEIINVFSSAVSLAYYDAKRRFTGIGKVWVGDKKNIFFKNIAEMIYEIFENPEKDFNIQHNKMCEDLNNMLIDFRYADTSYGKAQKIINMTFKYLYCLNTTNIYEKEIFQKCHMPLDSFTLEWCRRYLNDKPEELNSDTSWSGIKGGLYVSLQREIKNLLYYPLYAEFIIWPEMKKHIAAEEFIKAFPSNEEYNKPTKTQSLNTKIEYIKSIINIPTDITP